MSTNRNLLSPEEIMQYIDALEIRVQQLEEAMNTAASMAGDHWLDAQLVLCEALEPPTTPGQETP